MRKQISLTPVGPQNKLIQRKQNQNKNYTAFKTLSGVYNIMQIPPTVYLLVLVLCLLVQAINFASAIYGMQGLVFVDSQGASTGSSTMVQKNYGTILFTIIAAAISSILYIYLIISKICSCKLENIDWLCLTSSTILQFGIGAVLAVSLKNNSVDYALTEALVSTITIEPIATMWTFLKNTHSLMTAASVLSFVVGFGGGLFTLGRKTMELKQFFSATVNTEAKDQTSVEFIATQPK